VFEIGNSLREVRLRQQLELHELEQTTKIRSKYLKALEDEQFELLPAPTYVKGFLRNYADALGLEGHLYVDEYNSRFVTGDEDVPLRPRDYQRRPPTAAGHRFETRGVVLVIGGIAVLVALVIGAWKFGSTDNPKLVNTPNPSQKTQRTAHLRRQPVKLVLTAMDGSSWVEIRANSASGKTLQKGTVERGKQLALTGPRYRYRRLWVAAGRPWNLVAQVNGRVRFIPAKPGKSGYFFVTAKAIAKAPAHR
jgi:cytoskeletal protein RodZ